MKFKGQIIVGHSEDGAIDVMNGAIVFKLMDSHGMPLDVLLEILSDKGYAFDVRGFILAAKKSGNFSDKKLKALLTESIEDLAVRELISCLV